MGLSFIRYLGLLYAKVSKWDDVASFRKIMKKDRYE